MKKGLLNLLFVCLAVLSLSLVACGTQDSEGADVTPPEDIETPVPPSEEVDYSSLGLTEDQIRMLEEQGIANVESAELASKIAGFRVTAPAYIPEGFHTGEFMITLSGAGMPEGMKPKFNNTKVQQVYAWQEEKSPVILLIQTPHKLGVSGMGESEPVEINGRPGERDFSEDDPYDKLTFSWENDGVYYAISGMLGETLDEASLKKMAESIGSD
ncbi:hypothetical protein ACFLVB_01260 [Chloroflexota bacterium]